MQKNVILYCLLVVSTITSPLFAQSEKRNSFGLDVGLSTPTKPFTLGVSLDFRYLHDFNSKFGWDIFDVQVGTPVKGFSDAVKKPEQLGLLLMTGPRVYAPIDEKTRAFFSVKGGYCTNVTFDGRSGFCIEPQIGVCLTKAFSLSFAYNHSWTSTTTTWSEQVTERYVTGQHRVYLSSTNSYIWIDDYATRTVTRNHSESIDASGGSFYLKLGFDF
jgi:hypothetical protein